MNTFLQNLKNSFYNPSFYSTLHKKRVSDGVRNFMWYGIFLGIIVVLFITPFVPAARFSNFKQVVEILYPDDLVITIQDGVLSKNTSLPFIVPLYDDTQTDAEFEDRGIFNVLVIDTGEDVGVAEFIEYKTAVLITSDRIIARKNIFKQENDQILSDSIQIIKLAESDDIEINKQSILLWLDSIAPMYALLLFSLPFIIVASLTALIVSMYMFLGLLAALLVLVVSKKYGLKYSYKQAYVVSLYGLLPVITYDFLTDIIGIGNLFSLGAIVFLIVLVVNLKRPTHV